MNSNEERRVLGLDFDNRDFEDRCRTSIQSLNRLNSTLGNLTGIDTKHVLRNTIDGFNTFGESVSETKEKLSGFLPGFQAMEVVADQAIRSITHSLVTNLIATLDNGISKVADLAGDLTTLGQIQAGMSEYETQMNSIQTILNNTSQHGTTLDEVMDALNELNHYADDTIYNFTQMTESIGTFTTAGVELDTSVKAIKGIANLAAYAGADANQASSAMYMLSQALNQGKMTLYSYRSLERSGMGNETFRQALIKTAEAYGVNAQKIIEEEGSFRDSLDKGWVTSDILLETLSKFTMDYYEQSEEATTGMVKNTENIKAAYEVLQGNFGNGQDRIDALTKAGYDAAAVQELVNQLVAEGKTSWADYEEAIENADYAVKSYDQSDYDLAKAMTESATKVRTFTKLWDVLGEAAQSTWTTSWTYIIGDFDEATDLLTSISQVLSGIIGDTGEARNEALKLWHDNGGRAKVISALSKVFSRFGTIADNFSLGWHRILPALNGETLLKFSDKFYDLVLSFGSWYDKVTKVSGGITNLAKSLASIVKVTGQIGGGIIKYVKTPVLSAVTGLTTGFFDLVTSFSKWIVKVADFVSETDAVYSSFKSLETWVKETTLVTFISDLINGFEGFDGLSKIISDLYAAITKKSDDDFASSLIGKLWEMSKAQKKVDGTDFNGLINGIFLVSEAVRWAASSFAPFAPAISILLGVLLKLSVVRSVGLLLLSFALQMFVASNSITGSIDTIKQYFDAFVSDVEFLPLPLKIAAKAILFFGKTVANLLPILTIVAGVFFRFGKLKTIVLFLGSLIFEMFRFSETFNKFVEYIKEALAQGNFAETISSDIDLAGRVFKYKAKTFLKHVGEFFTTIAAGIGDTFQNIGALIIASLVPEKSIADLGYEELANQMMANVDEKGAQMFKDKFKGAGKVIDMFEYIFGAPVDHASEEYSKEVDAYLQAIDDQGMQNFATWASGVGGFFYNLFHPGGSVAADVKKKSEEAGSKGIPAAVNDGLNAGLKTNKSIIDPENLKMIMSGVGSFATGSYEEGYEKLQEGFAKAGAKVKDSADSAGGFIKGIYDSIANLITIFFGGNLTLNKLMSAFTAISTGRFMIGLGTSLSGIGKAAKGTNSLMKALGKSVPGVAKSFGGMFEAFGSGGKGMFDSIGMAVKALFAAFAGKKSIGDGVASLGDTVKQIYKEKSEIDAAAERSKKTTFATELMKFAGALVIAAAALKIVSTIGSSEDVAEGLVALGLMTVGLVSVGSAISKFSKNKGYIGMGAGMLLISASFLILAKTLDAINRAVGHKSLDGLLPILGILTTFFAGTVLLSNYANKEMLGVGIGMVAFAGALYVLVGAMALIHAIGLERLGDGFLAIVAVLSALVAAVMLMDKKLNGGLTFAVLALSLKSLAVGLLELIGVMFLIGVAMSIKMDAIATGFAAVLVVLGMISAVMLGIGAISKYSEESSLIEAASLYVIARTLTEIAKGLLAIVVAATLIGTAIVSDSSGTLFVGMVSGLAIFAVVLVAIVALGKIAKVSLPGILGLAVSVVALSVAMLIVAGALGIISLIPTERIFSAIAAVGAAIVVFGLLGGTVGMAVGTGMLSLALGIVAISGAILAAVVFLSLAAGIFSITMTLLGFATNNFTNSILNFGVITAEACEEVSDDLADFGEDMSESVADGYERGEGTASTRIAESTEKQFDGAGDQIEAKSEELADRAYDGSYEVATASAEGLSDGSANVSSMDRIFASYVKNFATSGNADGLAMSEADINAMYSSMGISSGESYGESVYDELSNSEYAGAAGSAFASTVGEVGGEEWINSLLSLGFSEEAIGELLAQYSSTGELGGMNLGIGVGDGSSDALIEAAKGMTDEKNMAEANAVASGAGENIGANVSTGMTSGASDGMTDFFKMLALCTGGEEGSANMEAIGKMMGTNSMLGLISGTEDGIPGIFTCLSEGMTGEDGKANAAAIGDFIAEIVASQISKTLPGKIVNGISAGLGFMQETYSAYGDEFSYQYSVGMTDETSEKNVSDAASDVAGTATDTIDAIAGLTTSGSPYSSGANVATGFSRGMTSQNSLNRAYNAGIVLANYAKKGLDVALDIHSPSRVMYERGNFVCQGLANGMMDNAYLAGNAATSLANSVISGVRLTMDAVNNSMSMDVDPTIRPVLDLDNVRRGSSMLNTMFSARRAVIAEADIHQSDTEARSFAEMIAVGNRMIDAIQNGSDLYLDESYLVGRINRRLGRR